jgi:sugar (pentulose or hexulose) kinase
MVVEQVGGGAAGYLWRRLRSEASQEAVDALDVEAETPGQAAYAAIEGALVLGLALLRLADRSVEVLGVVPEREDVREALLARAAHDAAAAGVHGLLTIRT